MSNVEEKDTDKQLNRELRAMRRRAKNLILNEYYDGVKLSELQYSILQILTNAEKHQEINAHLWNSGAIEHVLNHISKQIKEARKKCS